MSGPRTRGDAVAAARAAFAAAGLDSPALDARLLAAHAFGVDALAIVTDSAASLTDQQRQQFDQLVARRLRREPVSRIVGERWFHGRPFLLSPATLDPRPDSETLVDAALDFIADCGATAKPLRILDIGTGSGCLLLSLLAALPAATGVGVDVAPEALTMAATNATRLGIDARRIEWIEGSGLERVSGIFNIIASNPPYIPSASIGNLEPEVRSFDPWRALDGGLDGLDFYRAWSPLIQAHCDKLLNMTIFEVGSGQHDDVAALLAAAFGTAREAIRLYADFGGITRCVAVTTRGRTSC